MLHRSLRRAVLATPLFEAVEHRRLLSVVPDASFGTAGVTHFADGLPASTQYDQIVTASTSTSITTVAELSDAGGPIENQLLVRQFSTSGTVVDIDAILLPFSASDALSVTDVAVDTGGNTFVAGSRFNGTDTVGFVVKLDPTGTLDSSFAGAGSIDTAPLSSNSQNVQLAVAGGTVYAAFVTGTTTVRTANVLSFDSSGASNFAYGVAGTSASLLPQDGATVNELILDGTGLIVVGTTFVSDNDGNTPDPESIFAGRIDGAGSLDLNYGTNGFGVSAPVGYSTLNLSGVTRVGGGFVVAGLTAASEQVFVKLDTSLSLDPSFDGDGVLELTTPVLFTSLDRSTRTITSDAAGNVYATGIAFGDDSADLAVLRLDATGVLDTGFANAGVYSLDEAEADIGVGITTTPAGAFLVAGFQIDGTTGEQTGLLVQLAEPVVINNPPVVAAVATAGSVDTGVNTKFTSSFSDADSAGLFTVLWDFGDGSTQTASSAQGAISASHTYATAGNYTVTVTVTDSSTNSASGTGFISATTPNVAPVVGAVSGPSSVFTNVAANFSSSFSDANLGDTFTVSWNFGDGNVTAPVGTPQGAVSASHAYAIAGTYTVTVTIADSAGNIVSNTGSILVTTPPPPVPYTIAGGQLSLTGGAGVDNVELVKSGANYVLTVNGTPYTINSSLNSVIINGGNGADFIRISTQITIPVSLIGGAGNDTLRGGSGDDVIIGDDGDDLIIGRDGQDLMIGGTGADFLIGREDADILISGTTPLSSNLGALSAIMAEWTSSHSLLVKLANVTGLLPPSNRLNGNNYLTPNVNVFGDNSVDTLSGGDGSDLYYVTLFGLNGDIVRDNQNTFAANVATLVFGD